MLFQSLFTVLTVFAASLTTTDAAGSAGYTCEDWGIVPNTATLSATCMNSIGQGHSTSIPISNCVGNQNGVPGCQSKGGAGGSCIIHSVIGSIGFEAVIINVSCTRDDQSENDLNFDVVRWE
ncbi:uncharacterized protein STEHIDRAFT_162026 [Stereum hirsutum FP-91666 SS1]|uniref:uncharacterized protein n=1 Tax=Stereum hirsutum (strain FP-91666) TaxID=721885 RepID=UPI0004449EA5|nr:uncharacterized protein STEHIDRAFT_162026 [Stereum hirsutum FP-91666 SS1]EIM81019.1 hypothetical protein STEHIDRAFT_162026 [Stereum hirsutum FP-91666 SS1]